MLYKIGASIISITIDIDNLQTKNSSQYNSNKMNENYLREKEEDIIIHIDRIVVNDFIFANIRR